MNVLCRLYFFPVQIIGAEILLGKALERNWCTEVSNRTRTGRVLLKALDKKCFISLLLNVILAVTRRILFRRNLEKIL